MTPNDVPAALILLVISLLVVCVARTGAERGEGEPEREVGWDDLTPEGFEKRERVREYDMDQYMRKDSIDPKFFIVDDSHRRQRERMMENQAPGKKTTVADGEFDIKEDDNAESHERSTRRSPQKTGEHEAQ